MTEGERIRYAVIKRMKECHNPLGRVYRALSHVLGDIDHIMGEAEKHEVSGKSQYECPACYEPLRLKKDVCGVTLWCASKKCDCRAADYGMYAESEAAAFQRLQKLVEQEQQEVAS